MIVESLVTGCRPTDSASARRTDEPYKVLCTVGMITDIVRNIAGDYALVEGIIGEGVDPHLYKPTRSDVVKLSTADVVFYNGLLLEGKMTTVLERVASSGKPVKAVTEAILQTADYLLQKNDDSEHFLQRRVKGKRSVIFNIKFVHGHHDFRCFFPISS